MKIESLTPGQRLYSVEKRRMGNTMMRTTSVFMVQVTWIADDKKSFKASWNGNPVRTLYRIPSTWKAKKPVLVVGHLTSRLAHRDEIKAGTLSEGQYYFTLKRAE